MERFPLHLYSFTVCDEELCQIVTLGALRRWSSLLLLLLLLLLWVIMVTWVDLRRGMKGQAWHKESPVWPTHSSRNGNESEGEWTVAMAWWTRKPASQRERGPSRGRGKSLAVSTWSERLFCGSPTVTALTQGEAMCVVRGTGTMT